MTGTIKFYNVEKGYGFVKGTDDREYFFHKTNTRDNLTEKDKGFEVAFDVIEGRKGEQADNVRLIV